MTSKQLTPEDVHSIGVAALKQALELMADAEILLNAGRPRRGYALGIIAVEETVKSEICRDALNGWTGTVTVDNLNRQLRSRGDAHLARYTRFLEYLSTINPRTPDELRAMAKEDMRARERVLYVEIAPDGAPMTADGVDEGQAREWLTGMLGLFVQLGMAWRRALDDALAAARGLDALLGGGA